VTFIDTNVLVYAAADGAPLLDRARAAVARAAADGPVAISRQVVREYLSVMTGSRSGESRSASHRLSPMLRGSFGSSRFSRMARWCGIGSLC